MKLEVKVKDVIHKPIHQVYESIIIPDKLNKYFTSRSVGQFVKGNTVDWIFEDHGVTLAVGILELEPNKYISFNWNASGKLATVEIGLSNDNEGKTLIEIKESPFEMTNEDIQKLLQQTQGWTDFICSLKAYLYTGINLRNGEME